MFAEGALEGEDAYCYFDWRGGGLLCHCFGGELEARGEKMGDCIKFGDLRGRRPRSLSLRSFLQGYAIRLILVARLSATE